MLIPLGILAQAGRTIISDSYELIESAFLPTTVATITFSNLAQYASTYKHLQLRYTARANASYTNSFQLEIRLNGDTASNYVYHYMLNNGAGGVGSTWAASTYMYIGYMAGSGVTANTFAGGVIDILDAFSTTKNKTLRALSGQPANTVGLGSGFWNSTAAISSISIGTGFIQHVAGSRFSLYGIKG